jgi:hypothetical protein
LENGYFPLTYAASKFISVIRTNERTDTGREILTLAGLSGPTGSQKIWFPKNLPTLGISQSVPTASIPTPHPKYIQLNCFIPSKNPQFYNRNRRTAVRLHYQNRLTP